MSNVQQQLRGILQAQHDRRRVKIVAEVLAALLVLVTAYLLSRPAIAMEGSPICGLEEHTHTDACYRRAIATGETAQSDAILICGKTEHTHTQDCYPDTDDAEPTATPETAETADGNDDEYGISLQLAPLPLPAAGDKTITGLTLTPRQPLVQTGGALNASMFSFTAAYDDGTTEDLWQPVSISSTTWPSDEPADVQLAVGDSWEKTYPGATSITVTFSADSRIGEWDFVNIYKGDGTKASYSPRDGYMPGQSYTISGDSIRIDHNYRDTSRKGFYLVVTPNVDDTALGFAPQTAPDAAGEFTVQAVLKDENGDASAITATTTMTAAATASGSLGGVDWHFADGTLTLSGSGAVPSQPYYGALWANLDVKKLVVESGVTGIGKYAFLRQTSLQSVVIPADCDADSSSFLGCTEIEDVEITGTGAMTLVPRCMTAVSTKDLHVKVDEGVTSLPEWAFAASNNGKGLYSVELPGTLTEMGAYTFFYCDNLREIDIPEKITEIPIAAFRACKNLRRVSLPENLHSLKNLAFYGCTQLKALELPPHLEEIKDYAMNGGCTSITTLTIPASVKTIGSYAFGGMSKLRSLTFAPGSQLTTVGSGGFQGTDVEELEIPASVTYLGLHLLDDTTSMKELYWNAANANYPENGNWPVGSSSKFRVTFGTTFDVLNKASLAHLIKIGMTDAAFVGPNYFTLSDMRSFDLPSPLNTLDAGDYYVDAAGVLYRLYADHAALVYCPDGVENYTVPASVAASDNDETPLPVTEVGNYAFNRAAALTELTFTAPGQITALADLAFANAANLALVNGKTTRTEVLAIFAPDCTVGQLPFQNTKITNGDEKIADKLVFSGLEDASGQPTLTASIATATSGNHTPAQADDGTQLYYTGEVASTLLTVSNPVSAEVTEDDGAVLRVYMTFSSPLGKPDLDVGTYTVESESGKIYKYTLARLPGTNTYYFEVQRPRNGDTISIYMNSLFASGASAGGTNVLWGALLSEDAKNALDAASALPPMQDYQRLLWDTKADDFPVTKTLAPNTTPSLIADGEGTVTVGRLSYQYVMERAGDTLEGIGKDLMTQAIVTDTLTLPDTMRLRPDVQEVIEKQQIYWSGLAAYTNDGTWILTVSSGDNARMSRYSLTCDDGKLALSYRLVNNTMLTTKTEMPKHTVTITYADTLLQVTNPKADSSYTLSNHVEAVQKFQYYGTKTVSDDFDYTLTSGQGRLRLTKQFLGKKPENYGNALNYILTANNPAVMPYTKMAQIEDEMTSNIYMTADNIAAMYAEDTDKQLRIQMSFVTVTTPMTPRPVTGLDGVTTGSTALRNTTVDTNNKYSGMSTDPNITVTAYLTITWCTDEGNADLLTLELYNAYGFNKKASCAPTADAIQKQLDEWGVVVYGKTSTKLIWNLRDKNGDACTLYGGQSIVKNVYATAKDTFALSSSDHAAIYPTTYYWGNNSAWADGVDGKPLLLSNQYEESNSWKTGVGTETTTDFTLNKSASADGNAVHTGEDIHADQIVDFSVKVTHAGTAVYDVLPLTDRMTGACVLLAEYDKNKDADWVSNAELYTAADGTQYYKLNQARTYTGVWLNGNYADTVIVKPDARGTDTLIYWYFTNYTGKRTDTIQYRAYVEDQPSGFLSISNQTWLGDHQGSRLYANIGVAHFNYSFSKEAVETDSDTAVGRTEAPIREGQTVIYRLALQGSDETHYTLTSKTMYDQLPRSLASADFTWTKGDGIEPGTVKLLRYSDPDAVTNGDDWDIVQDENDKDLQYLRWGDNFKVTLSDTPVYIYIRMTYPSAEQWAAYCNAYSDTTLVNRFFVEEVPADVTHALMLPAHAWLQKGVFAFNGQSRSGWGDVFDSNVGDSWLYYQNDDLLLREIGYYTVLRNDGTTRLYLTDMQDVLPKGFTLKAVVAGRSVPNSMSGGVITTVNTLDSEQFTILDKATGGTAKCRVAKVTAKTETNNDGVQKITFHFESTGTSATNVHYDEDKDMYYLLPGEEIQFGYYCRTNEEADTEKIATNAIAMPYYDYNEGGIKPGNSKYTTVGSSSHTPNDGTCAVLDNAQALAGGFTGGKSGTQWLESHVTVERGGIQPGITKQLIKRTSPKGQVVENPASAGPEDTLQWKVTTQNDGSSSIVDYVLTDTMPYPYVFSGELTYEVQYQDTSQSDIGRALGVSSDLLKIVPTDDEDVFTLYYSAAPNNAYKAYVYSKKLRVNGDAVEVYAAWRQNVQWGGITEAVPFDVQLTRDAETGSSTLSLHFKDARMCLMEHSVGTLTLSTATGKGSDWANTVYTNISNIIPLKQSWNGTPNQGNLTTVKTDFADEELPGVRNSAPVTVSYGYTTSSLKTVTETGDPANTADGGDQGDDTITLADKGNTFRYTLSVFNSDPSSSSTTGHMYDMTKLVLIDSLPQPGDHTVFQRDDERFSDFKVSLADDYAPEVIVETRDGQVKTLADDQYKLEFSTSQDFEKADWAGTSEWTATQADARSLRLTILETDENDPVMPAGCTIRFSFTCKVDDADALPGQTAWNSFGYCYSIRGSSNLEAAPLKVGVSLPAVPTLQKTLQYPDGTPYTAEQDDTFVYCIYAGDPLTLPEGWTRTDLLRMLDEKGRSYRLVPVTVKEGESASEVLRLENNTDWRWQDDQNYTVVELPVPDGYAFASLNDGENGYTFTYHRTQDVALAGVNTRTAWNFLLEKVDADNPDTHLSDAWFALYSPTQADALDSDAYKSLPHKPARELTADGKTWYLADVRMTNENGILQWENLLRTEYRYCEIFAPNGYSLDETVRTANRFAAQTVTLTNKSGYVLPKTGGSGTGGYYALGALLVAVAAVLLRRRRSGKESTK